MFKQIKSTLLSLKKKKSIKNKVELRVEKTDKEHEWRKKYNVQSGVMFQNLKSDDR